jgi:hypothetical protein
MLRIFTITIGLAINTILHMSQLIFGVVRIFFLGLATFESANLFGFLHFTLDFSWLGLVITSLASWLGLELIYILVKRKYNYTLSGFIFVLPAIGISFDAFGDIFKWYSKFSWYDQVAHFLGSGIVAVFIFLIMHSILFQKQKKLSNWFAAFFAFSWANVFGILYEIEEYLESYFLKNNRLGDRFDTPNDLLFNMFGALVFVLFALFFLKRSNRRKESDLGN